MLTALDNNNMADRWEWLARVSMTGEIPIIECEAQRPGAYGGLAKVGSGNVTAKVYLMAELHVGSSKSGGEGAHPARQPGARRSAPCP